MIRIIRFLGPRGYCSNCSRMVFSANGFVNKNWNTSTAFKFLTLSTAYVNLNMIDIESQEVNDNQPPPALLSPVNEACINALHAIAEFFSRILEASADSFLVYKDNLNELYSSLEKYETHKGGSSIVNAELEDAIIAARSKVIDSEKKYIELLTLTERVKEVSKAIFHLSFLVKEEALVLKLQEKLNYIAESIKLNTNEIKDMRKKLYEFESSIIANNAAIEISHEEEEEEEVKNVDM